MGSGVLMSVLKIVVAGLLLVAISANAAGSATPTRLLVKAQPPVVLQ
jgi:hypothetical protein